jgi:hypothetical protein
MHKALSIVAFLILFTTNGFSQPNNDTILLLNGNVIITNNIDTTKGSVTFKNPKHPTKNIVIANNCIFSISNNKGETLLYSYDSLLGNYFSIDEMRYYIRGEQDAQKKFKARGAFWSNLFIGAGAGVTGFFFAPVAPFAFSGLSGITKVKIKKNTVSQHEYLNHVTYIMGYESVAYKKRKIKSLISGGIGLAVGVTTFAILKNNDTEILK